VAQTAPSPAEPGTSVRRALAALRLVAEQGGANVTEVALQLGVHKSTASRLMATLAEERFLEREPGGHRYCLGSDALCLAGSAPTWATLSRAVRPALQALAETTRTTINLAVVSGNQVMHVDQADDPRSKVKINWVGKLAPAHCTSVGKILLAFSTPDVRDRILAQPLASYTPNTVTDVRRLREELGRVRSTGIAHSMGEYEVGLNGVAAPIRRTDGSTIAALCASGLPSSLGERNLRKVESAVRSTADRISHRLGA